VPKAYLIAHITVTDPDRYPEYTTLSTPAVESFGGRFVARGGTSEVLEGESKSRHVIIEFPDLETARAFYASDAYQEAASIRRTVAESDFVLVEGA
jgi:uncharacterized protein (DUF1330 family)